jgi:hypothetical protein
MVVIDSDLGMSGRWRGDRANDQGLTFEGETGIEQRIEATGVQPNYSGRVFTEEEISKGVHRRFVGASSDEAFESHGARQLEFLKGHGLRPEHKLLDVGCGCFRAGRYFIDYLDRGNYYGVDANLSLMQTGYDIELSDQHRARLQVENLRAKHAGRSDPGSASGQAAVH